MKILLAVVAVLAAAPVLAQDVGMAGLNPATARLIQPVVKAANDHFARMPLVQLTSRIADLCGGDTETDPHIRYCTSSNIIYVAADIGRRVTMPETAAYLLAHAYGHAVQVRHGVADVALRRIIADRPRETELRGMVTRQVECIAGTIFGAAHPDARGRLSDWVSQEPFTGAHWGADPISARARVSIGLEAREDWFERGRARGDLRACAAGDFSADLLLRARR